MNKLLNNLLGMYKQAKLNKKAEEKESAKKDYTEQYAKVKEIMKEYGYGLSDGGYIYLISKEQPKDEGFQVKFKGDRLRVELDGKLKYSGYGPEAIEDFLKGMFYAKKLSSKNTKLTKKADYTKEEIEMINKEKEKQIECGEMIWKAKNALYGNKVQECKEIVKQMPENCKLNFVVNVKREGEDKYYKKEINEIFKVIPQSLINEADEILKENPNILYVSEWYRKSSKTKVFFKKAEDKEFYKEYKEEIKSRLDKDNRIDSYVFSDDNRKVNIRIKDSKMGYRKTGFISLVQALDIEYLMDKVNADGKEMKTASKAKIVRKQAKYEETVQGDEKVKDSAKSFGYDIKFAGHYGRWIYYYLIDEKGNIIRDDKEYQKVYDEMKKRIDDDIDINNYAFAKGLIEEVDGELMRVPTIVISEYSLLSNHKDREENTGLEEFKRDFNLSSSTKKKAELVDAPKQEFYCKVKIIEDARYTDYGITNDNNKGKMTLSLPIDNAETELHMLNDTMKTTLNGSVTVYIDGADLNDIIKKRKTRFKEYEQAFFDTEEENKALAWLREKIGYLGIHGYIVKNFTIDKDVYIRGVSFDKIPGVRIVNYKMEIISDLQKIYNQQYKKVKKFINDKNIEKEPQKEEEFIVVKKDNELVQDGFKTEEEAEKWREEYCKQNGLNESDYYIHTPFEFTSTKKIILNKQATIKHENGVYNVYSESGKCLGKGYKTKEEAEKRLKQVEYFKNKKSALSTKPYFQTSKEMVKDALDLWHSRQNLYNKKYNTDEELGEAEIEQKNKEYNFLIKWNYEYGDFMNTNNDILYKLITNQISIEQAVEKINAFFEQVYNYDPLNPHKKKASFSNKRTSLKQVVISKMAKIKK